MTITGLIILLMFVITGLILNIKSLMFGNIPHLDFPLNSWIGTILLLISGYVVMKDLIRNLK